ncbi:guanitoxin biosynthesis L-arginine gamma (S) hydroxylase [Chitinimonas naiadis]
MGILVKHEFSPEVRKHLTPLFALNNWSGPLGIVADLMVIIAAVAAAQWSAWLYPLAVLLIGSRQRALASLLHESCHKTLTRHRRLNDFIGRWLAGFPIFQSHRAYVKSHVLLHHNFLGDAQRDPDYRHYIDSGLFQVRDRLDFVVRFVLRTVLMLNVGSYLRYLCNHRLKEIAGDRRECLGLLLVHAVLIAAFTFTVGPLGYVVYWLVPFLTTFQVIGWFSEIAEHYPLALTARTNLAMTRNRFPTWTERVFIGMHGDNYHQVHHLFAGIPFWNLARAHQVLLADPAYAATNRHTGGIFTARPGARPVLLGILDEIRGDIRVPAFHLVHEQVSHD